MPSPCGAAHRLLPLLLFGRSSAACPLPAPRIGIVSKIIVDSVAGGAKRLGGGGVQAAVGARLAVPTASVSFIAPAGTDFDTTMLDGLRERGVDADGVHILSHVPVTPGQKINYDTAGTMLWQNYGWEGWDVLCDWVPPLGGGRFDVIHAIVEGGGRGEVEAAGAWLEEATASWCALRSTGLPGRSTRPPVLSLEPVMHSVTLESIAQLARITPMATSVSPDLLTAGELKKVVHRGLLLPMPASCTASRLPRCTPIRSYISLLVSVVPTELTLEKVVYSLTCSALFHNPTARIARLHDGATPPPMSAAHVSRSNSSILAIARACAEALKMQPDAILAIRDGANGSYVYNSGDGGRGSLSSSGTPPETLSRVLAVEGLDVRDPTGAGNAYSAALAAQLSCVSSPVTESLVAAKIATAAGAAFCATGEWAPLDMETTAAWVSSHATALQTVQISP